MKPPTQGALANARDPGFWSSTPSELKKCATSKSAREGFASLALRVGVRNLSAEVISQVFYEWHITEEQCGRFLA
jgi:hypothetical protein